MQKLSGTGAYLGQFGESMGSEVLWVRARMFELVRCWRGGATPWDVRYLAMESPPYMCRPLLRRVRSMSSTFLDGLEEPHYGAIE